MQKGIKIRAENNVLEKHRTVKSNSLEKWMKR